MHKIGFIGLGAMGLPMAQNLLAKGEQLYVYDVVDSNYPLLEKNGAIICASIKELVQQVEVIFASVQTGEQVKAICLDQDGIFNHAKPGTCFIDCSSIDISTTQFLHNKAAEMQLKMLDAPVSGGVVAATNATLTIMVGGNESLFQSMLPLLSNIGKKIVYAGSAGSGQAAKICNNMLLAISMIGVAEAFCLAKKLGLDQKKFFEISSSASGQCWAMTSYCPVPDIIDNVPANRSYQPGFKSKMMLKDLLLAQNAANFANASTPLGTLSTKLYESFVSQGNAEIDFSAIIKLIDTN